MSQNNIDVTDLSKRVSEDNSGRTYDAVTMYGDTMYPEIEPGDYLLCIRTENVYYGRIYVFDTENGKVVGRAYAGSTPDTLRITTIKIEGISETRFPFL